MAVKDETEAAPSNGESKWSRGPQSDVGSRFGGLTGAVEASIASSIGKNLGSITAPYPVTATELSALSNERTRAALADLLETGVKKHTGSAVNEGDAENPSADKKLENDVMQLVERLRAAAEDAEDPEDEKNKDMAANVLTSVMLRSSPESGIDPREVLHRQQVFGSNALAEKELESFLELCWEAVQEFVLIMLIVLGIISIVVEVTTLEEGEDCKTCWIEGAAILASVCIIVLVTAGIDYAKQFAFIRLNKSLHDTNTKSVIRDGKQVSVIDDEIVVGDILSVNSHNLASIPADCVLLGPPADLKMNEASLTGESHLISKNPGDIILSGTNAVQGSGKMVVIAV